MHCLSIREPYVSFIMTKNKTLEFRTRKLLKAPETIAIATSKAGAGRFLPGGHIVGVARVSAVVPWRNDLPDFWERAAMTREECGGNIWGYAMMLSACTPVKPAPVRGNVGIYNTPDGWEPEYFESGEQLAECYENMGCTAWDESNAIIDDEQALINAFYAYWAGWRIDD